jgi:hypothetical protein
MDDTDSIDLRPMTMLVSLPIYKIGACIVRRPFVLTRARLAVLAVSHAAACCVALLPCAQKFTCSWRRPPPHALVY